MACGLPPFRRWSSSRLWHPQGSPTRARSIPGQVAHAIPLLLSRQSVPLVSKEVLPVGLRDIERLRLGVEIVMPKHGVQASLGDRHEVVGVGGSEGLSADFGAQ